MAGAARVFGFRSVGEAARVFLVTVRGLLLFEARQNAAEIVYEEVGEVVAESIAYHDAQCGEIGAVGREGVGGYEPAAFTQGCGDVEDGEVVDALLDAEGEDR